MTEFKVIRGNPTPEELAAITAVVLASTNSAPPPGHPRRALWTVPVWAPAVPGPGAWRASGLPR